jgi:hypothetical protein
MAAFESLPPDQRAVLQLILAQGRSYDDLASVLRITPEHVRARAMAGARTLAGGGPGGGPQGRVVDYLLGQLPFSDRLAVRAQLASDPALRAWALALSRELEPVATEALPEVPKPAEEKVEAERMEEAEAAAPGATPQEAGAPAEGESRRSLLGGALLLAGLAVLVVVLVVALTSGGSDDSTPATGSPSTSTAASSTTPTSTTTTGTAAQTLGQANLTATTSGSRALAVARLQVQGSSAGFDINAQGLSPKANAYFAVWVAGAGGKTQFLGAVLNKDVKGGRFRRVAPVPSNISDYNQMIISSEPITSSQQTPSKPTSVVLRGPLKLVGTG